MPHAPARRSRPVRPALLALGVALLAAAAHAAPAAAADPLWVCGPGATGGDPCRESLSTTTISADGRTRGVERARPAPRPRADCFYVYPTVTGGGQSLAQARRDPAIRAVSRIQVGQYARHCRVFAPAYRQVGLTDIAGGTAQARRRQDVAYRDVRTAWRAYRRANPDRGVVVVGHSQGTAIARRLIREEIDPRPSERRRLVSAVLLGGDVVVGRGRTGGDFRGVPACRRASQTGCLVAFSAFGQTPPGDSLFGRVRPLDGLSGLRVACTNPGRLGGGTSAATVMVPSTGVSAVAGAAVGDLLASLPRVRTPWIRLEGAYRARCSGEGGANVLRIAARTSRVAVPEPSPAPGWGLHLTDANIAQGELVDLVGRQVRAWADR